MQIGATSTFLHLCLQFPQNTLRGTPFSAATFEVSFLSVIALLPVSVKDHLKAYVVNFPNSHIILIWLPWQRYKPSDWLNTGTDVTIKRNIVC